MSVTIQEIAKTAVELTVDTLEVVVLSILQPCHAYRFFDAVGLPPGKTGPDWSDTVTRLRQDMDAATDPAHYAQIAKSAFVLLGAINSALSSKKGPTDYADSTYRAVIPILMAVLKKHSHVEKSTGLYIYTILAGIVLLDQRMQDSYPEGVVEFRWLSILRNLAVEAGWIGGDKKDSVDWAPIVTDAWAVLYVILGFADAEHSGFARESWPERSRRWSYFSYGFDHPEMPGFETARQIAQRAFTLVFYPPAPPFTAESFDTLLPQRPPTPPQLWELTLVPVQKALDPAGKGEVFIQVETAAPFESDLGGGWKFKVDTSPSFGVLMGPAEISPVGEVSFQIELSREWPDAPSTASDQDSVISFRATQIGMGAQVDLEDLAAWLRLEKGELAITGGHWLLDYIPKLRFTFDITAQAALHDGIQFKGGAGGDILIPVNQRIPFFVGALTVEAIRVRSSAGSDSQSTGLILEGTANLAAELFKVLTIRVTGIGASYALGTAPQGDGNMAGAVQFGWNPVVPSGASLEISAWKITGGGGVFYDSKKDEVSGALELDIGVGPNKKISLKGLGLYQRATAQAVKSWLLLVTVEQPWTFPGVTLEGLGLLYASNRKTSSDAFLVAIGNGNLSALLFGGDVVKNAPSFIAALETLFPGQQDAHVLGLMANFTALSGRLTLALGLLFEYQASSLTDVYVIGRFTAVFNPIKAGMKPDPDKLPVYILADGVALWNCATDTLDMRIQLRNSRVWSGELTGGASVFHGSPQNDATKHGTYISVGGFHPDYTAPPGLFVPPRLSLVVSKGDHLKIQVTAYIAVTPSSFQFGFGGALEAHLYGFGIRGSFSLDVLIAFDGKFMIAVAASVELLLGSETLMAVAFAGQIAAWSPTVLSGKVEVKFLFWTLSKSGSCTIQEGNNDQAESQPDVAAALATAVADSANWENSGAAGLTLVDARRDGVWLSPSAPLRFRQTVAPLNVAIERFGSVELTAPLTLKIDAVNAGATPLPVQPLQNEFALGMFLDLSQEEMLAGRGFESRDAGVEISRPLSAGQVVSGSLDFQEIMLDPLAPPPAPVRPPRPLAGVIVKAMTVFVAGTPAPQPVLVRRERYTVVDATLKPLVVSTTIFEARAAMRPGDRVVPEAEVR